MINEDKLSFVLGEFARTMITDFPIQSILDRLVDRIVEILPISAAGVTLISQGSTPHYLAASDGAARRFERLQTQLGQGPCVEAFETGRPVAVPDLSADARFPEFAPAAVEAGLAAVFTFPLCHGNERFGALDLYRSTTGELSAAATAAAQTLADVAAALLLNAQAREQALATSDRFYYNAMHDPLTGLPNRLLLQERIEHAAQRAQREHSYTAVLFLDLDRFKEVNDNHGHHIGDELLCSVARRLATLVRSGDTLSRVSGDEFVFLCEELKHPGDVTKLVERINDTFLEPFQLGDVDVTVGASVGVAYVAPGEAITPNLLRRADLDMYRAKRASDARADIGHVTTASSNGNQSSLEADMHQALVDNQLDVAYQPIMNAGDDSVAGVEALLRWTHPQRGPVPAPTMVALAERSDLICEIGAWIMEQACRDHSSWTSADGANDIDLAVNVSVRQLVSPHFCRTVTDLLDRTNMDPCSLVFELTESIAMEHSGRITQVLAELSELGIRLALDDFGTGYSALNYLSQMPIDIVKLDRSLIVALDQLGGRIVAGAVTDMAHELGLEVVAEGVETETHRTDSIAIGCDYTQGYLHAHPMPSAGIRELFVERSAPITDTRASLPI